MPRLVWDQIQQRGVEDVLGRAQGTYATRVRRQRGVHVVLQLRRCAKQGASPSGLAHEGCVML